MDNQKCKICGCTDDNCLQCIEKTGGPCYWFAPNFCSACAAEVGLNHSLEHLKSIFPKMPFLTIQEQAKYADRVCTELTLSDKYFVAQQLREIEDLDDPKLFKSFNTTSIGNCAFMALFAENKYALIAERILMNYKNFVSKNSQ